MGEEMDTQLAMDGRWIFAFRVFSHSKRLNQMLNDDDCE